jgi:hypothetical protein
MNQFTKPELDTARSRFSELAIASIANPALEPDYQRAVADVAKAEAELKGMTHG